MEGRTPKGHSKALGRLLEGLRLAGEKLPVEAPDLPRRGWGCDWGRTLRILEELGALVAPGPGGCGWPLAYKDNYLMPLEWATLGTGQRLLRGEKPAVLLERARLAGAALVARTTMHPLGLGVTNVNPVLGTPSNPAAPGRVPGGSSGGPAVAVASGAVLVGLGSDAAGSVRIPAAFTGTAALTLPGAPREGLATLQPSLEVPGLIAGSPSLLAAAASLLGVGEPGRAPRRLLVPLEWLPPEESPLTTVFWRVLDSLAEMGFEVVEVRLPLPWRLAERIRAVIALREACIEYWRLPSRPDSTLLPPGVAGLLKLGCSVPRGSYLEALRLAGRFRAALTGLIEDRGGLLASPAVPMEPPTLEEALEDESLSTGIKLTRLTGPVSLAGLASLVAPVTLARLPETGLPFPLMISGSSVQGVLAAGIAVEKALSRA